MKEENEILLVKMLEGYAYYFRESWKQFLASGGMPITHNKFYEFMKDKIAKDITNLTGADKLKPLP